MFACSLAGGQTATPTTPAQTVPPTATAQSPAAQPPTLQLVRDWSVKLEPQVWYVAPEGDLLLGGSAPGTDAVELSTLSADDPEVSAAGQVTIRVAADGEAGWESDRFWNHGWFFTVGGASFNGSADSTAPAGGFTVGTLAVAGGAAVSTDVEWSSFHIMAGKWLAGSDFNSDGRVQAAFYGVIGLRVHSQDISIASGGTTVEGNETFVSPLIGLRLDLQLPCDFAVDINANVNFMPGDTSSFGFEIAPTFTWRPTRNIGVQLGYRLLIADNESGDEGADDFFSLDGSLAGLYGGVEIRF